MHPPIKPLLCLLLCCSACHSRDAKESESMNELQVTATAYNSLGGQTSGNPTEGAWGDTLRPGMKAVAVSRDLLDSGLTHGTLISIDGLPGEYQVLDKMNRRWTRKIDIYMGATEKDAREWGKRSVTIRWEKAER